MIFVFKFLTKKNAIVLTYYVIENVLEIFLQSLI